MLRWLRRIRLGPKARPARAVARSIRHERAVLERWARRTQNDPYKQS